MKTIYIFSIVLYFALASTAQRTEINLEKNWKFTKWDFPEAINASFDD